mgnify:CR=1 FL=1
MRSISHGILKLQEDYIFSIRFAQPFNIFEVTCIDLSAAADVGSCGTFTIGQR